MFPLYFNFISIEEHLHYRLEIALKHCIGFVIYEDFSVYRMEEIENLVFKIFC